jgi:hypothetical protein
MPEGPYYFIPRFRQTKEKEITIKERVAATEKNAKKLMSHLESIDKKTKEGRRVSGSEIPLHSS